MAPVADGGCCHHSQSSKELRGKILKAFLYDSKHKSFQDLTDGPFSIKNHLRDHENVDETVKELKIAAKPDFSVFIEEDMREIQRISDQLQRRPINNVINAFCYLRTACPNSTFVDHLARVTFQNHPASRHVPLPPPHEIMPFTFFKRSKVVAAQRSIPGVDNLVLELTDPEKMLQDGDILPTSAKFDKERRVAWWREDLGMLNHHYNWHIAYPYPPKQPRDRQGELFGYMHEQMLARYDFERIAVGLNRVQPYGPGFGWDKPLVEGFNSQLAMCSVRGANINLSSSNTYYIGKGVPNTISLDDMKKYKDRISSAIAIGFLYKDAQNKVMLDLKDGMNHLGNTIQANQGSVNKTLYGNLHNNGHVILGRINDPSGMYQIPPGPMNYDQAAPRDPVFFRWHKFIDNLFEEHRSNLPSQNVRDLVFDGISIESFSVKLEPSDEDKEKLEKCKVFSETENHFYTHMENKWYKIYNSNATGEGDDSDYSSASVSQKSLNHIPFSYEIKVKNDNKNEQNIVFRIFLAPEIDEGEPLDHWRRMFVELDKFVVSVKTGTKTIKRHDIQSSVILNPQPTVEDIATKDGPLKGDCMCGWPLNLLVPRGTAAGMKGNLYVMASDWNKDGQDPYSGMEGSASYCGKQGATSKYPDKRPMGFPFDRLAVNKDGGSPIGTLGEFVEAVPNSFSEKVTITFLDKWPVQEKREDGKKASRQRDRPKGE